MDSQPVNIQTPPVVDYRPPAVREAAERADQLHKDFIKSMGGEVPGEVIVAPPPSTQVQIPVVTPPVTPSVTPPQPEVITRPAAMVPVDDDGIPPAGTTPEVWEQRFRSFKGRVERERADQQVLIQELTDAVRELQARPASTTPNVTFDGNNIDLTQFGITQDEIDLAGPELTNLIKKAAFGIAAAQTGSLREQIAPDVEEAKRVALEVEQQRRSAFVNNNLDSLLVPKYNVSFAEINKDRNFLAFLKLTPPGMYVTFHELLKNAWASYDAPRVLQIVNAFLEGSSAAPTVVTATPAPVTPAAPRGPQIPLVTLAAPGSGHAPSAPASAAEAKPTYTRADVQAFYRACARGHLANDPAQKAAYEAEIASAAAEGRII